MEQEPLRVLYLGGDSPEVGGVVGALDRAREPEVRLHWEAQLDDALVRLAEETFDVLIVGPELVGLAAAVRARVALVAPRLPMVVLADEAGAMQARAVVDEGAADWVALDGDEEEDERGTLAQVVVRAVRLAASQAERDELSDRYEALLDGARDALWHWDVRTDRVRFTTRWAEMVGVSPEQLDTTADAWFARVHPSDVAGVRTAIAEHLAGQSDACEVEYRVLHADGTYRWVVCRGVARKDSTGSMLFAGSHTDVHEFKSGAGQMLADLFRDPLTGLPSRALFLERLGRAIARLKVDPREIFAVLVLDLDRFQKVNDGLGHAAGDRLLTEVTERLSSCLREGDTLARLGSDKFAILLEAMRKPSEAVRIAERVLDALAPPIVLEGEEVYPSAGLGVALSAPGYEAAEDLMNDAYSAMHRAKEQGGSRYEIFDPEEQARTVQRLRLEADLRRAIEREELCLHYQPIVDMTSGGIRGFEALVRWIHPERGLVSPGQFVPLAEETGLISGIGSWVLNEACKTSKRWNDRYAGDAPLGVSVNLSGKQFADPDLVGEIEETIGRHGLDPLGLKLEITESVLMENSARNTDQLDRLRGLGLELMIDDFGTGYSSLSSLHRFPIETLKIDRTFVNRMEFEEENSEIVRTIMTLGQNLDMSVVAEGVETQAQRDLLRELGCDMGQGFLFSNAVDAESAEAWLSSMP